MSIEKINEYIDILCKSGESQDNILVAITDMMNYLMAHPQLVARAPPFRDEIRRKAYEIFGLYIGPNCPYNQGIAVEAADTARCFLRFLHYVVPLNQEFTS